MTFVNSADSAASPSPQKETPILGDWEDHEERRLVLKIDMRCLPVLTTLFLLNFLRSSLANGRLKGLQEDLNLNDTQYATSLSILYIGYIFMQVPSNLIMNTIPTPRLYLAFVAVTWGSISALTALCKGFSHIVACRFFLGFVEAAIYPGAIYYLSRWYTRKEMGFRIAVLNIGATMAQGLGGLIAAGVLSGMEGAGGIRGWRWLFIIEGSITVAFGLLVPFILADYPSSTKWLSEREIHIAQGRLVKDVGLVDNPDEAERSSSGVLHGLILAITDIKVWALALMYFTYLLGLSFGQYFPSITETLGFNTTITLLLTFPPWAFATIFVLALAWHSDRTGERYFHIAFGYAFIILGYILAITSKTTAGKYISLFGMCMGYGGGILLLGWISTSIPRPPIKRAAAIAIVYGFGNIGQIPALYLWPSKWAPKYRQSCTAELCFLLFSLATGLGYRQYLVYLNKKLENGEVEVFKTDEKVLKTSANLVNATADKERQLIQEFRYLL